MGVEVDKKGGMPSVGTPGVAVEARQENSAVVVVRPVFDRRAYMRVYMRDYRAGKRRK